MKFSRQLFLLVYGASGAAALIYEVAWTRLLTLQMGHGIAAASTVLAAFMGGLAIGSAVGGRIGGRLTVTSALRAYAGIEVAIALLALLLPLELAAVQPLLAGTYANGDASFAFPLLRLALSLFLLALPTAAMGATFPIASRWMVPSAARAAADAGRLYAVNTIGAALGAVLAGFVLLPALGLRSTIWVGVALNLSAAAVACLIAVYGTVQTSPRAAPSQASAGPSRRGVPPKARRIKRTTMPGPAGLPWVAALAAGLSGFASLTLQVVWTRLLALILGPTTYAFSLIVALFIGGLATGSALASPLAARSRNPVLGLALCLLASVALAAAAAVGVDWALLTMARIVAAEETFGAILIRQGLLVAALLLPMTIAFGAVFPFAVAVGTKTDDTVVSDLGRIYAVNTLGAITGSLLTGFVLITQLGLHNTIRFATAIVAVGTLMLLLGARVTGRSRLTGLVACVVVLVQGFVLPPWNHELLSSGAYKYASVLGGLDLDTWLSASRLLYYREGATGTVAVREVTGTTSLSIDGKVDASNVSDMLTQRLLAHLPLLLHPEPRQVAILGLGSGVTLGAALKHPITRADVLEISPEVVDASRFFEPENHNALADPRTHLIVADGRPHLSLSRSQYDVIVSEPSNPWMAGIASLFTREFFESARARLAPGGVLCQWAHTYDISDRDLQSIVATFLSVFPDGTMWLVGEGDVLLIGSTGRLGDRFDAMGRHYRERPGVAGDLLEVGLRDEFSLLSLFVAEGPALARYAAGAVVQTDDRLGLEFSGPRSIFGREVNHNDTTLRELGRTALAPGAVQAAITRATPAAWRDRGEMFLRADAYEPAWRDFVRAVEADPADGDVYEGLRRAAIGAKRTDEALSLLKRLAADPSRFQAASALSRLLAAQGNMAEAVAQAVDLLRRYPDNLFVLDQAASVLSDANDTERLQPVLAQLRRDAPASESTRYHTAALLFMQGRPDLAVPEAEAVVRKNPRHALAQNVLGAALASIGERDRARSAFEASLRANPLVPGTYINLATLEMQSGNGLAAARRYAEALTLNPTSETARQGLTEAMRR